MRTRDRAADVGMYAAALWTQPGEQSFMPVKRKKIDPVIRDKRFLKLIAAQSKFASLDRILSEHKAIEAFLKAQPLLSSRPDRNVSMLDLMLGTPASSNIRISTTAMLSDDMIKSAFEAGGAAATVATVAGEAGALPPAAIYGGGGAGLATGGFVTGGVLAAGYLGYVAGKAAAEYSGADTWWGDKLADTDFVKALTDWYYGFDDAADAPAGGDGDQPPSGSGVAGGGRAAPTDTSGGGDDAGGGGGGGGGSDDGSDDASNDDADDGADDDDDDDDDAATTDTGDSGTSGTETDDDGDDGDDEADDGTMPNPLDDTVSIPPDVLRYILASPFGRLLTSRFARAIETARSGGLLPPDDAPLSIAELSTIFPALARMIARQRLAELRRAIGAAAGDHRKDPGAGDDPKAPRYVSIEDARNLAFIAAGRGLITPVKPDIRVPTRRR